MAQSELGIAQLLDPEDVDVDRPDEKSVMTYIAQFLHRYPEGHEGKVRKLILHFYIIVKDKMHGSLTLTLMFKLFYFICKCMNLDL